MFHQSVMKGKNPPYSDNTVAAKEKYFILTKASPFYAIARVFMAHFLMTDEKLSLHGGM